MRRFQDSVTKMDTISPSVSELWGWTCMTKTLWCHTWPLRDHLSSFYSICLTLIQNQRMDSSVNTVVQWFAVLPCNEKVLGLIPMLGCLSADISPVRKWENCPEQVSHMHSWGFLENPIRSFSSVCSHMHQRVNTNVHIICVYKCWQQGLLLVQKDTTVALNWISAATCTATNARISSSLYLEEILLLLLKYHYSSSSGICILLLTQQSSAPSPTPQIFCTSETAEWKGSAPISPEEGHFVLPAQLTM